MSNQYKVYVFIPEKYVNGLIKIMAEAGAGVVGDYTHNAFIINGIGNWFNGPETNPTIGIPGEFSQESECKVEMPCPEDKLTSVIAAIKSYHPYESPVIEVVKLEDVNH